jgi:hypothetical protein
MGLPMQPNFYITVSVAALLIVSLLSRCASPSPPSGGPIDEDPPVLDTAASSPLMPVNFSERNITLEFDEFIELNNPAATVVISPPLEFNPEFQVRGRRVIFRFDPREELRSNTTYTINFGDAIRDFTEGNILRNFVYVLSTGPVIDSLELAVRMVDAYTGAPVEDALALMHEPGRDSALLKQKPLYFAASDERGLAEIKFMKAGEYALFGLTDQNRNYIYDLPDERVGFFDDLIDLRDTTTTIPEIRLFKRDDRPGTEAMRWRDAATLLLKFNRRPESMNIDFAGEEERPVVTTSADTMVFHFRREVTDTVKVLATFLPDVTDTLYIRPPRESRIASLRLTSSEPNLRPGAKARLTFNQLLDTFNLSEIKYIPADTVEVEEIKINSLALKNNTAEFRLDLEEGKGGEWHFLPGAFTDVFGEVNDTLKLSFYRQQRSSLANLTLTIEELEAEEQYILILENPSGEVKREIVTGKSEFIWNLDHIRPEKYTLRVVLDRNKNNRWDPGHILRRIQPEEVSAHEIVELRANWDFEQTIAPFQ